MTEPYLLWGLALFAGALFILVLELFIPSGGVLTLLCCALTVAGVVCFFRVSTAWGIGSLASVGVLGPVAAYFFFKIYPDTPMGRRLILGDPEGRPARSEGADDEEGAPAPAPTESATLIGMTGLALTDLRPAGTVELDGKRIEATSEVGFLGAGRQVRVTAVEGTKVRVRGV